MPSIAVIGDAHLLMQAEWLEDESKIAEEGEEVIENFWRALEQLRKESPDAVIFAGDMFDYRTKSGQRVSHREGEKYMLKIRDIISSIISNLGCKIYALKGNHDSEPVLKSLEKTVNGFFHFGNKFVNINGIKVFLLNSNYVQGPYEIPLEKIPSNGDLLIMHESMPVSGLQGPSKETFQELTRRFKLVLNAHMHTFSQRALGLQNFFTLPALIPSREIKGNWMLKYYYPAEKQETRETPFGYVLVKDGNVSFVSYKPIQTVVRVEIRGKNAEDFLLGVRTVYDFLDKRSDRSRLRVWIETDADPITIDNVIKPEIASFKEIRMMDIIRLKEVRPQIAEAISSIEFGNKAFTLDELTDRVLAELKGVHAQIARQVFDEIFTKDNLIGKVDESLLFKHLLELIALRYRTSEAFVSRAWELAKER
jgi:predicted phosphodiesterase